MNRHPTGLVKNVDERGRAGHLHSIFASELGKRGASDGMGEEWLSVAVESIGAALGADYVFEAYLSGVDVEHIVDAG